MTWQKIKAIQRNLELHWIGLFVLLILGGCLGDILNYLGHPFIRVNDLDAVSMVILQIQGTIDTLSIALLALLGGRITESYMGVSLIDYVMNKKPVYLNQKKMISCLIVILSTSVFFHLIELYNLVFAWFLISEGLILLSVAEIYEVFSGHVEIENEIKSYLIHQIESETYSKKLNIVHGFCNGWKTVIISQSEPEFETYRQIFSVIFETIFLDESPNSRLELQKYTHHIIYTLLSSETLVSKRRGVKLVHEIYKKAWTCIRSNEDKVLHFQDGFHLFREISDNLQNVVVQLPIAVVERELRWHSTAEYVLLVNFWVAYDPQNPYELKNLGYMFIIPRGYHWNLQERNWPTIFVIKGR